MFINKETETQSLSNSSDIWDSNLNLDNAIMLLPSLRYYKMLC